ncbi:hypothetical protein CHI12_06690 [Terribacillus saccharophilus]|uniref:LXG domain-containing protein n=2 Tax=Terribacillus saccharophilus TaxID=361277 RepID=A0A268HEL2_9BACI|nr:hypothetical protein CHI12_06690 [Terribacillus saccharophilus]
MESFLVQYEQALSTVSDQVLSFEPDESGFIRQEFLEGELTSKMQKAQDSLSATTNMINQQLNSVSDLASVSHVKDDVFLDSIAEAKKRITKTVDGLYEMDSDATSKLDKSEDDMQQMKAYVSKLRSAIDKNNITVDKFNITQFNSEFFSYHNEFKLMAKGRNALATGEKAEITAEEFNKLYPYKKNEELVIDEYYEWDGTYYTLNDGRIVRHYKHNNGEAYEFVDKIPDPRSKPLSDTEEFVYGAVAGVWNFFTEDLATVLDPEATKGEKAFALAMFLPVGKPVKIIDKGSGFVTDGIKSLEKIIDNHKSMSKGSKETKLKDVDRSSEEFGSSHKSKTESSRVNFSEMTLEEQLKVGKEYSERAPIKIPEETKIKAQSKNGYEQLTYKWKDESYKYEVRWHTKTPGAPENQGNTWVVQRTLPGNGGNRPQSFFKIGENEWIEGSKWYEAISARKSGNATPDQLEILDKGHWKD